MNCLAYRRQMETAPDEADAAAREHARQCPACAALTRRIRQFDRNLQAAARVRPPEDLTARILMRQSFGGTRRSRWRRSWPALAAGLLVFIAVGLYAGHALYREAGLQRELVALVAAADYALAAQGPVADSQLRDALEPVGLALSPPLQPVSFAGRCLVRGNLSGHVVMRDESVPVTVFLMPDEQVPRQSHFRASGWQGTLVPATRGTVGIVVPDGAPLDQDLVRQVMEAVSWQA